MNKSTHYNILQRLIREEVEKAVANKDAEEETQTTTAANKPADSDYDGLIKKTLGVKVIPEPVGDYTLGEDGTVDEKDKATYQKLYKVAPPKADSKDNDAGSKGTGHGEIAMYWLLSKGYDVQGNQGGGNPDLLVDGKVGVEVKSYEEKKFSIGRIGSDVDNLKLLTTVFSLHSLTTALLKTKAGKLKSQANAYRFNGQELAKAFETFTKFNDHQELRSLGESYGLIKDIYNKVDEVTTAIGIKAGTTNEAAAKALLLQLVKTKLKAKPGDKGYIANVSPSGKIDYTKVDVEAIKTDTILSNVSVNQGQLVMNMDILK